MDNNEFKTRADRLEQIAKILENLPAEVRSDAFELLKSYVTEHSLELQTKKAPTKIERDVAGTSDEEFFAAINHDKPANNARLIAAWFFREYGLEPFSMDEVRAKAIDVGITIPARVDMTLISAMEKGKKLFARAGAGKFKPTVHGETYLKTTYAVKTGTKKRAGDAV